MSGVAPGIVHLIWLGEVVPPQVERLRVEILRHDPALEVRVWRDGDLDWLANRDLFRTESRPTARADIARYEILHREGGIYLDADMRVHAPLAGIRAAIATHGLVVARQSRTTFNSAFLAAAPGHPLLADLIARIPDAYRWTGRMTVPATTGPHLLTERLLAHVRAGGRVLELPQHVVYPWYSDEDPLPDALIPPGVLLSHGWAGTVGWAPRAASEGATPVSAPVADRRARRRRSGRTLRARAAATPAAHQAVADVERAIAGPGRPPRRPDTAVVRGLPSSTAQIEGWTARTVRRTLRGSAVLLDLHPTSALPALAAASALDRPGRAIVVLDDSGADRLPAVWRDRSIRCSMHVVRTDADDPERLLEVESYGSALVATDVAPDAAALGGVVRLDGRRLDDLVGGLPRIDLVRVEAARLRQGTADALQGMVRSRRVVRLLVTLDPATPSAGLDVAVGLLEDLEAAGTPISTGPWLLDGRGRTWWQQLRVAARPFVAVVG